MDDKTNVGNFIVHRFRTSETRAGRKHRSSTQVFIAVAISEHDECNRVITVALMFIVMVMTEMMMAMSTFHNCRICTSLSEEQKQPEK